MAAQQGYWDAAARRWRRASGTASGPLWDPRATLANAEEVRRRIDQEFGFELLEARFAFFRSAEDAAVMPGLLLDSYPIEYGMHLCLEHAEEASDLPPGYLARTDAFCSLYLGLREELTEGRWRSTVRDDVKSGLGTEGWGELCSLSAALFQMRFWSVFRPFAAAAGGFELVTGPEEFDPIKGGSVTADFVLRAPTGQRYSVECKSLGKGPFRSRYEHHLRQVMIASPAIKRFLTEGAGVAHLTLPGLDALDQAGGRDRLGADIANVLEGGTGPLRIALSGGKTAAPGDAAQARALIRAMAPATAGGNLFSVVSYDLRRREERGAYIAFHWPATPDAFAKTVRGYADRLLNRQGLKRRPAILAVSLDFLTIMQAEGEAVDLPGRPTASHAAGMIGGMEAIKAAIAADPACHDLYGILFWMDDPIHSASLWEARIGTTFHFWRNPASPFADGALLPFDRFNKVP